MNYKKQFRIHSVLLIVITLGLLLLPMGPHRFWGTDGDWYSQHTAIADSLRQTMLEQKSLLPQFISLGGGSSIYDFSYYGLLRPDVLFSCLIPQVDMKVIVAVYALLGVVSSVWLCYIWLKKYGLRPWSSFAGSLLFGASASFYQAHHQIMFVNYMPFLILALLGVERVLEKRRCAMLAAALFFIYIHSFYYAVSCLFVVGLYALQRMLQNKEYPFGSLFFSVFLSLGMAMALLLPTGLDILSTSKDGGSFAAEALSAADFSLESLLYSPYGCGMTLLTLYLMLLSLRRKGIRLLAGTLLGVMLCPAAWFLLNGFLYARAKILIPCVPLLALTAAETLERLGRKKQKPELWPLAVCLLPVFFSRWAPLAVLDGGILTLCVLWGRFGRGRLFSGRAVLAAVLCVPLAVSFGVHKNASYLKIKDDRQESFSKEEIAEVAADGNYRFENIANNFVNSNCLASGDLNRTSMYSSVTNDRYAEFYYNTMGNAISANNRVALTPGENPCFNYLMGVRYLLTKADDPVPGYEMVARKGDYVLAENSRVLPICYGTAELMDGEAYDKLAFPDTLAALNSRAVVRDEETGLQAAVSDEKTVSQASVGEEDVRRSLSGEDFSGVFEKQEPASFFADPQQYGRLLNGELNGKNSLALSQALSHTILVIRFRVEDPSGGGVEITINGVKNKLSAKSAPYPNQNHVFTYVWDTGEALDELKLNGKGDYCLRDLEIYTANADALGHQDVTVPQKLSDFSDRANVYGGQITMEADGYFVTSYPWRKGYCITVDGEKTEPQVVNTAFVGFPISAGTHRIAIGYEAPGYREGLWISGVSWALWAFVCAASYSMELVKKRMWKKKKSEVVVLKYL